MILKGINDYLMKLAEKQIQIAFDQAQKEVDDLRQRTKEGLETARNPFYIKIVGDKFAEVHSSSKKPVSAEVLKAKEEEQAIVGTVVTEARVRKILHKLVDEGILPENWGADEMPIVAKNLPRAVFEDCLKEEPDVVAKVGNFGKVANNIAMKIARGMI